MTVSAKVEGLERLRAKMLAILGPQNVAIILRANQLSAREFERTVRVATPVGDPAFGHLVETIRTAQPSPTAVSVSIGDDAHPYPMHLETGHRARDGSHVPGRPFWFAARRVTKKKAHGRIMRAERAAIKAITGGGK